MSGGHGVKSRDPHAPRRDGEHRLKEDLEAVRRQFYEFQMRKDREMKEAKAERDRTVRRYELQLQKTVQENKKILTHSTNQSKKIQELLQEKEERNIKLRRTHEQQIALLQKEKEELANDVAAAKATAHMYHEDFEKERMDRAKAAGRIDSLERDAMEKAHSLAERFQKEMSEAEAERKRLDTALRKAMEEVQAKASQVKQYKKQVETLQRELREAQQKSRQREEMVLVEMPDPQSDDVPRHKKSKLFQWKNKTKEEDELKARDKATMKAAKKERERTMKEGKQKRKEKMDSMDEKKLKEYLGNDINRLENENFILKNRLECSEATTKTLVDKLDQAEARVKWLAATRPRAGAVQSHTHGSRVKKLDHSPGQEDKGNSYVNVVVSADGPIKSRQRQKSVSEPQHEDGPRAADVLSKQIATEQQQCATVFHDNHHGAGRPPHIQMQSSYDPSNRALNSKDVDYVNLPPAQTAPLKFRGGVAPVNGSRQLKTPKPAPRAASVDSGYGGPLIPVPESSNQPTSMPAAVNRDRSRGGDISDKLDTDIRNKAAEVMELGQDEGEYGLSSIPFDPYLECLYCNQQFRYGEIQKYRKHVMDCSGGSTV